MYPPGQSIDVVDGGMALSASGEWLPIVVGYACGGTANELYRFNQGAAGAIAAVGRGPGSELAADIAAVRQCLFLRTAASTAGSAGAVSVSRVGTSTGTITVTGSPVNSYKVRVRISTTGTLGTARFQYALDGYSNTEAYGWSSPILVPAGGTYTLLNTGITTITNLVLTFVPGAGAVFFEAGDIHRFDCVAPHYTTGDLDAAFAVLRAKLGTLKARRIMFAGQAASATAAITIASAAAGYLDTLAANAHFCRAVIDGGSADTLANFRTAIASFTDDRIGLVFSPGGASITTRAPATGLVCPEVPAVHAVAERWASTELSESLGRVQSGALRGVRRIGTDEWLSPSFTADDRIITLRSDPDEPGYFVTKSFIRSSPTSDFRTLPWGTVIDEVCQCAYASLGKWKEAVLQAKTNGTGFLLEASAKRIETDALLSITENVMNVDNIEGFKGHAGAVSFVVSQTNDYLTTGEVRASASAVPLRECDGIITTVSLTRSIGGE
jgi:hypothetical protein